MKGVQCYELFGGIALKNHAFSTLIEIVILDSSHTGRFISLELLLFSLMLHCVHRLSLSVKYFDPYTTSLG